MGQGSAKILIIDDEIDLRESLKYLFMIKGYEVELAEDGVQGLKKLEAYTPDLIILDLNMPNMGGIDFYHRICEKDIPKYPVLVLTARANMEQFFKDFNVNGFMAKPFEVPDLIREVGIIIDNKTRKTEVSQKQDHYNKIFIVETDGNFSAKLGAAFLMKGFSVNLAQTGADAIERISKDVPDVACIKMNLADIPGDAVISKLKRMAKTSRVKYILYTHGVAEKGVVTDAGQHKFDIDKFVVISSENDLLEAVKTL